MSTSYTADVEVDMSHVDETTALAAAEKLQDYHAAVGNAPSGNLGATITFPADNLRQAIATALTLVEAATGASAIAVQVVTTAEFDRREGFVTVPDLLSVAEYADLMGISRQAAGKHIDDGKLRTAKKVGGTTVIATSEGVARAKAAGRDVSAYEPRLGG